MVMLAATKCIRIHVPLDLVDTRANVFSYPRLVAKLAKPKQQKKETTGGQSKEDAASMDVDESGSSGVNSADEGESSDGKEDKTNLEDNDDSNDNNVDNTEKNALEENSGSDSEGGENEDEDDDDNSEEGNEDEGLQVPKRRTRTDPSNVYDIDDAFIDDSDMLDADGVAPKANAADFWPFGYFAWRGKVENFHEDIAFQDFFEAPRTPAPKKKRGFPAGQTKTITSKKPMDASPMKPANATVATASGIGADIHAASSSASSATIAGASFNTAEKKRKRASATGTPLKAKPGDAVETAGDAASSVATTAAKKKKRVSTSTIATPAVVSSSTVATGPPVTTIANATTPANNEDGDDDAKGKKKSLLPLSPAVQVTVNYLKNEREKESFENKKNFPQNLRPPLLEASKIALQHDEMNENFIRHIKKVLPYNSFTLKRLIGRMLLNHALMQSKIMLTMKTTEFEKHIKELCAQQGITGPQIQPEEPPAPVGDTLASLVVVEKKKFKFDDESKLAIWNLLVLEWEQAELENLLNSLDGNSASIKHTDANIRKGVYPKLVAFWPAGWMTTVDLSREYSLYKRRINTRVNAAAGANAGALALGGLDVGAMYIENVTNMLAPDNREVFKILKAMKAMFSVPAPAPATTVVKAEEGVEKKEATPVGAPTIAVDTSSTS
ncbi:hypothetical protein BDR26DRAFT_854676 [Obelidium mucronatum]|nr:hypothetical protein BDR26DRAFT_854676 [Obelidium mucronatum]